MDLEGLSEVEATRESWQTYLQGTFKESRQRALRGTIDREEDFVAQQRLYDHFVEIYDDCAVNNDR